MLFSFIRYYPWKPMLMGSAKNVNSAKSHQLIKQLIDFLGSSLINFFTLDWALVIVTTDTNFIPALTSNSAVALNFDSM